MAIDPTAVGAVTEPHRVDWTERDTMSALGVGAGTGSVVHHREQLTKSPAGTTTYAVIRCIGFAATAKLPRPRSTGECCCTGLQEIRAVRPASPGGFIRLWSPKSPTSRAKGEGKNAIVVLRARGNGSG